jgi:phosphomannomutase
LPPLKEPQESEEFRLKIKTEDFKTYGQKVIDQLQEFASTQATWTIVPKNHEGIRIACQSPEEDGWLLLRLSLHDPVLPLNIESNVEDGVAIIRDKLLVFFKTFDALDLSAME